MKLPTDLVKMYKEIHGWVGIISGLALFIAFYAGAITMFETQLQRWASPPPRLAPAPSLERTPELVAKVIAAHPEAAKGYELHLQTDSANPARMSWTVRSEGGDHDAGTTHYAALTPDGGLQVESRGPSEVAELIDVLHQQVGLPFAHEVSMPIMGAIALLYMVAIVSGLIVLLPSLVSDLFALRLGRNVKRMWLDMHNVVGLFSLPFHIIMALTAIVFAFHDQFYDAQDAAFGRGERPAVTQSIPVTASPLPPAQIVARLRQQAPGFTPLRLDYHQDAGEPATLRVEGHDARYGHRAPTYGIAGVDPYDGTIIGTDYMPGHQDGWSAAVTSFFALHFGNFGGNPIRWSYFLLGIAGAFLFYTGNLLWVESRRKRERKAGAVIQSRSTRILGALTVGVPIGCIAGISVTLAAAKLLGEAARYDAHSAIYYAVFVFAVAWALLRGAARAGIELPLLAAATMLTIPAASLIAGAGWYDGPALLVVDIIAIVAAGALVMMARAARNRAKDGPRDSIWAEKSGTGLAEATSNPC